MSNVYQAPEAELENKSIDVSQYGTVEKAIKGEYEFSIGDVLSEAWKKTSGSKLAVHIGFTYYLLVVICIAVAFSFITGEFDTGASQAPQMSAEKLGIQLFLNLIGMPMFMGLAMIGIKRSVDSPIRASLVFSYFSKMIPLFITMLLMYLMIFIGLVLLVLPGIYLMVAYYMAMPLVVEKGMSPWQAMEVSRKSITHRWFSFFALFLIIVVILSISMIPMGLGLIWTLPMVMIIYGIMYRNMFGVEPETLESE